MKRQGFFTFSSQRMFFVKFSGYSFMQIPAYCYYARKRSKDGSENQLVKENSYGVIAEINPHVNFRNKLCDVRRNESYNRNEYKKTYNSGYDAVNYSFDNEWPANKIIRRPDQTHYAYLFAV